MGGNNSEFNKTNRMNDAERRRSDQEYGSYIGRREGFADDVRNRSNNDYNDIYGRISGMLDDPDAFGSGNYREFARTGGMDEENKRRIRGLGVFDEFARDGGISEGNKNLIRMNSAAGGREAYNATQRRMDTGYNATNGFNAGYNAQNAAAERDAARELNRTAMEAELGIEDRVNEGRRWGAGSASQAELGLVDALQRGKMFGAEGMRNDGAMRAQLADSLRGLRSDTPGELAMYEGLIANGMGSRGQANQGSIGLRAQMNPKGPSAWDRFTQVAGMAAPFLTAGMSGGGQKPRNTGFTGGNYGGASGSW